MHITITSNTTDLPAWRGISDMPSGRFPSVWYRPAGSLITAVSADRNALATTSFTSWYGKLLCPIRCLLTGKTMDSAGINLCSTVMLMWNAYVKAEAQTNDHSWRLHLQALTLYGHIKTAEQWTIIRQYGDWYTGRWRIGCSLWYSEEGPGWAVASSSPLLAVPNVTAHPSTASVPTSYYSMWHYNYLWTLKGSYAGNDWQNTQPITTLRDVAFIITIII